MREIKFRAWDKHYKEMIEDIWIAPEYGWLVLSDNDALAERERPKRGQTIIMQYTGLGDKNGREIYEGDILAYPILQKNYWVKWDEHNAKFFACGKSNEFDSGSYRASAFDQMKIIGNIYENPELVGGKHG